MNKTIRKILKGTGAVFVLLAVLGTSGCGGAQNGAQSDAQSSGGAASKEEAQASSAAASQAAQDGGKGYCAVGKVDAAAKTAKILLGSGEVVTAAYAGEAPKSGMVQTYQKENGVYTFARDDRMYPPYGERHKQRQITVALRQRSLQVTSKMYVDANSVFFVRYSATQWRVVKGRGAIAQNSGGQPGYTLGLAQTSAYVWYTYEFDRTAALVNCVMIVGECGDEGAWKPANAAVTKFMDAEGRGFDSGDRDLS
jgi:hypothetical protein